MGVTLDCQMECGLHKIFERKDNRLFVRDIHYFYVIPKRKPAMMVTIYRYHNLNKSLVHQSIIDFIFSYLTTGNHLKKYSLNLESYLCVYACTSTCAKYVWHCLSTLDMNELYRKMHLYFQPFFPTIWKSEAPNHQHADKCSQMLRGRNHLSDLSQYVKASCSHLKHLFCLATVA